MQHHALGTCTSRETLNPPLLFARRPRITFDLARRHIGTAEPTSITAVIAPSRQLLRPRQVPTVFFLSYSLPCRPSSYLYINCLFNTYSFSFAGGKAQLRHEYPGLVPCKWAPVPVTHPASSSSSSSTALFLATPALPPKLTDRPHVFQVPMMQLTTSSISADEISLPRKALTPSSTSPSTSTRPSSSPSSASSSPRPRASTSPATRQSTSSRASRQTTSMASSTSASPPSTAPSSATAPGQKTSSSPPSTRCQRTFPKASPSSRTPI